MTIEEEIKQFIKQRNEAFMSLDEKKIREHQRKWSGLEMTTDMKIFWGAVHKAITGTGSTMPIEFRKKSKAWLDED